MLIHTIVLLADELVCGAHGRNNESAGLMVVCCALSAQFVRAGQNVTELRLFYVRVPEACTTGALWMFDGPKSHYAFTGQFCQQTPYTCNRVLQTSCLR